MKRSWELLILTSALSMVCEAVWADDVHIQVGVTGYVPVICHVQAGAGAAGAAAIVDLGNVTQFCNAGRGYQLWADTEPNIAGVMLHLNETAT